MPISRTGMVSYEKALELISSGIRRTDTGRVPLEDALFRFLAEDVRSDIDMPPFDKAAMDGYACRKTDLGEELEVLEVVAAGEVPAHAVGPRQCIKIMTGAMMPRGADTVIMIEHTAETKTRHIRFAAQTTATNIAYKGEDVKEKELVLQKGTLICPEHIAVLAAVGCSHPLVAMKVKVAVLSTGDELVEPSVYPDTGKIRNSNGAQLAAQVRAAHCIPNYMGIVPDTREDTHLAISKALSENDVVLLSGGVSMGAYDFVPEVMRDNNVDILFHKVEIKPGRPTVFGRADKTYIFGLPGNPVSSFINFEVMVKPLLFKMMGGHYQASIRPIPLAEELKRKKGDRPEWLPVRFNSSGQVVPVNYHGSAHIHAMCLAQGLAFIPKGVTAYQKGTQIDVRSF
jgi:molybdopterin molybdotransferase